MRAAWRKLRAESAYAAGTLWLLVRQSRMPAWQVRDELAWLRELKSMRTDDVCPACGVSRQRLGGCECDDC